MNQTTDYKKLANQIGIVLADILMIVGGVFTIAALIGMHENGTKLEYHYLDGYDYNLMTMKTYGIAMMVGGWIVYMVNMISNLKQKSEKNEKEKKSEEESCVCEVCGIKSSKLKTVSVGDNEKIKLCPQCYDDEKQESAENDTTVTRPNASKNKISKEVK